MAERPDELNKNTKISTTETDAIVVGNSAAAVAATDASADNVYLEKRSTDDYSSSDADDNSETPADEKTDNTEHIREQIEETRSNLGGTINAIQDKLTFSNISGQVKNEVSEHINSALKTAKDSVYDATLGKVGTIMSYVNEGMNEISKTNVGRAAGQNPLALSLIGLGLGMILINGFSKKRTTKHYNYNRRDDDDRENNYNRREISSGGRRSTFETAQNKVSDYAGQAYEGIGNAAGAVSSSVSNAAGKVSDSVSGVAGKVSDSVSNAAGQAYEQVGNLGAKAKDYAGSAQEQYEYYMDENPLAVGAVAMAIGAAVGLAFPSTQAENRLMGETRENLMHKAEDTAREAIGKVQQVAGEVSQTVKDAAGDIAQTAKDEAKKQGLTQ